jgi:uncharacterized membrane protein YbhN (UPF0104 family)
MKKFLRNVLGPIVLIATIAAFIWYLNSHPEVIDQIKTAPKGTLVLVIFFMALTFLAYVWVTRLSLNLYDKTMGRAENLLFNSYSSLINFFGPGQSGPIFRGAYLKKRHNVTIKQYVLATLIYFGFYAVFSILIALAGSLPWWQTAIVVIGAGAASWWFVKNRLKRAQSSLHLGPRIIGLIGLATAVQVVIQIIIFGIELNAVSDSVGLGQILSYTGVANLTLFVSFTPGGIGIRESFLLFSQNLHGIDSATVVAASVIDRSAYLVFLGLLFLMVIALHGKDKLGVKKLKADIIKR